MQGCVECDQLWADYGHSVMEHVRLTGQFQIASMQYDSTAIERLAADLVDIENVRRKARSDYLSHIATHQVAAAGTG